MKAFTVNHYGPDGLAPADIPAPTPGPRDVLIDVRAASINPLDKMVRNGEFKQLLKYRLPFTLGHDLAGVIVEIGSAVTEFAVGDEVFARPRDLRIGTFAELIAVDAADVARKPPRLTFAEAGAVPLVALAAWQALVELADIQPGQKVLVHAGAGGLGSTVIQVAKHLGAFVATTAGAKDQDKVRELGADIAIDYSTQDFTTELADFDVVLDSLGEASLQQSLTILKPGGLAISVVGPPDPSFARQLKNPLLVPVMHFLSRKVRAQARKLGVRYSFLFMHANGEQLTHLAELYEQGALTPIVDRSFPFSQTLDAMEYVEQGRAKGKVVITR